jgi:uncharacterized protein YndB with AHSA1/START domain
METKNRTVITVETTLQSPLDKAWQSFTEPRHITQWCQASEDWHAPFAENDLRTGGKFKTTMAAKDKSMQFDFGGTYTNVQQNKIIEYTMDDGRRATVTFSSEGNSTRVTETFEAEDINPIDMQRGGWQAILDSYRKYTETGF